MRQRDRQSDQSPKGTAGPFDPFVDETIAVFQPYSRRELTHEDAREIAQNVTGLFGLLLQLKKARFAREQGNAGITLVSEESP